MKAFKLVVLLGLFSVLSACNLPTPKDARETESASFAVKSFEGRATSVNIDPESGIPVSNTYNYKACLTDLRLKKPMIGHKFEIVELGKEFSTDVSGCLHWPETVHYNFLAVSRYLKYQRTIRATGVHDGQRIVTFAIDPWSHGEKSPKEAVDLSKSTLPEEWLISDFDMVTHALRGDTTHQRRNPIRSLWMESGRILAQEDRLTSNGFEVTYEMHLSPQLILSRINGERVMYDLTIGNFKAEVRLIHTILLDGKVQRTQLASKKFEKVSVLNKALVLRSRMNFKAPTWGHLYMGVRLIPMTSMPGLEPFEGLFYIGDYKSARSSGWLKLSSLVHANRDFSVEKFLQGQYEAQELQETPVSQNPPPVENRGERQDFTGRSRVAVQELNFKALKIENDKGTRRTLKYLVEACFREPINGDIIRGLDFTVNRFRQNESDPVTHPPDQPLTSQMDGCITWAEELPFETYACQEYIKGFVEIQNKDLGMNQRIHYYINPWGSTPSIAGDELKLRRNLGDECKGAQDAAKPRFIFVNFVEATLQKLEYILNEDLDISAKRKVLVEVAGSVVNHSDLMKGMDGVEPLKGYYLVRLMVASHPEYSGQHQYIASANHIVLAKSGKLQLPLVDLWFRNAKDIYNRNSVMLQVLPVDSDKIDIVQNGNRIEYVPKKGLTIDQVIDKKVPLTPIIYEGKAVLAGTDSRSLTLIDMNGDLVEKLVLARQRPNKSEATALLDEYTKISAERLRILAQLEEQGQKAFAEKAQTNAALSTIESYAKNLDLDLVRLDQQDKPTDLFQRLANLNIPSMFVFRSGHAVSQRPLQAVIADSQPMSKEQLIEALEAPEISPALTRALCLYWVNNYLDKVLRPVHNNFRVWCARVSDKSTKNFFLKETLYHVNKVNSYQHVAGDWHNYTISSSFSMNYNHTSTTTQTNSVNVSLKLPDFHGFGIGGQVSLSHANQESHNRGNSIQVNDSTTLEYQKNTFRLELTDYQKCQRIRINPNIFQKPDRVKFTQILGGIFSIFSSEINHYKLLNPEADGRDVMHALHRGFLVCYKPKEMKPLTRYENFYVIQQRVDWGRDFQDGGNPLNRYLFMVLRGDADFTRFDHMAKRGVMTPESFYFEDLDPQVVKERLLMVFGLRPSAPKVYIEPPLRSSTP